MPYYECVYLARQDIAASQVEALSDGFAEAVAEGGGTVKKREYWGLRNLAYRVKKNRKAHYVLMNIEAPPAAVHEMQRLMRLNADVLRELILRVDELTEGPSIMMQRREERRDRGDRRSRRDEDRRPERSDSRGKAPAEKAPAEKSAAATAAPVTEEAPAGKPADKAAAEKAPAEKAPAKTAPAKTAPAKAAPAEKAAEKPAKEAAGKQDASVGEGLKPSPTADEAAAAPAADEAPAEEATAAPAADEAPVEEAADEAAAAPAAGDTPADDKAAGDGKTEGDA